MHELQVFENEDFGQVRTLLLDGAPWFVGVEIAKTLGYSKPHNALKMHVDEDDSLKQGVIDNMGRTQETIIINESGLYCLIFASKLSTAKSFKRWVTSEILPSIRKYGGYITDDKLLDIIENPDRLEILLQSLLIETQKKKKLQQEIAALRPKAQYFDSIVDGNLLVNFRTTAKEIGIKPMFFVSFLLDRKYLYRDTKQVLNPYQSHVENGLFQMKEYTNHGHVGTQTMITTKGREHFLDLFLSGEISINYFIEQ